MARCNLAELPNTMFTIIIHWVSNGKDMVLALTQLQASYTDVRHLDELVNFIDKGRSPKEPYILRTMYMCTMDQDGLEEKYIGIYKQGQIFNDPRYGQISQNCSLSNAFKLKL
jgi:hypothetical protein